MKQMPKKPFYVSRRPEVSDENFMIIMETMNHPRSWFGQPQFPFVAIDTQDASKAHWTVGFATPKELGQLQGSENFENLSVTFLERENGRDVAVPVTLFNWTNWNSVPIASHYSSLQKQRQQVINHEFGHVLGEGHRKCDPKEGFAPIMLQQTKGLFGCRENPWPLPHEVVHASKNNVVFE